MTSQKAFEDPGAVHAVEGEVVQLGPDGVGLSMTPEAAEETGKRLQTGAEKARSQPKPQGEND